MDDEDNLIERAKAERRKLVQQIRESQRTIEHSREIVAQIDRVVAEIHK